ncbi:MAG: ATP-binding protein [Chitinispirillia bacterium]|nr:ATP-binding protein [Chitinispirillia bacterium]MCL2241551.1 ATP-binding protein [Chitinispirillia bacterium]
MKKINRLLQAKIEAKLNKGKVLVLYGPRQVGKTTLARDILLKLGAEPGKGYFNCEEVAVRETLLSMDSGRMSSYFSGTSVIVLDEAQSVPDIGKSVKLLIDSYPKLNIIATGSSSFELANRVSESLAGRKYEFLLPPLSFEEIRQAFGNAAAISGIADTLIYGSYPEIATSATNNEKIENLRSLATSYLYRDVLNYNRIKSPDLLMKILKALALQIGSEVSPNELAGTIQIDRKTVQSYLSLLEQAFVVFRLPPFVRKRRDEIKLMNKYYFFDNGILNALIGNFQPPENRNDTGALWENYLISERRKFNGLRGLAPNSYFWRTHSGQEIDLIEEADGELTPFEFKYNSTKIARGAYSFVETYGAKDIRVINKNNVLDWLNIAEK